MSSPSPELASLATELERDVRILTDDIGERNTSESEQFAAAAEFLDRALSASGWKTSRESYPAGGISCSNIIGEHADKKPGSFILIGAHYDSCPGTPGADDNASAVAILLALARMLAATTVAPRLRFVAFANEEPPYFYTEEMGSLVHARGCRKRGEQIEGMICLESLGLFTNAPGSQGFPGELAGMYPTVGNFVAIVSNFASAPWLEKVVTAFAAATTFPHEYAALPETISGVGYSDHWAFWQEKYPALMFTDTAPFRNANYHAAEDTAEKLNYPAMAVLTLGLRDAILKVAAA